MGASAPTKRYKITPLGWATTPDSLAARTVTISAWVLGILLHASYTANLMSSLTVVPTGRAIHSVQEFVGHRDWKLLMDCTPLVKEKWKTSSDEHERELHRIVLRKDRLIQVSTPETWPPFEETATMLMCTDIRRLRYFYGQDSCQLTTMLDELVEPPIPTHIAIAKGLDTLRDDLNKALMFISESGWTQRLQKHWLSGEQVSCTSTAEFKPLSFTNLLAMLLIIPLAVAFSAAILGLEWLWHNGQQSLAWKFSNISQVSGIGADLCLESESLPL